MDYFNAPLFQALFNTEVPRIILKADTPTYTILEYNQAFVATTYAEQKDIKGKSIWDVYHTNLDSQDGVNTLAQSLEEASTTKSTVLTPVFRYDLPSATDDMIVSWWQLEIIPVKAVHTDDFFLLITTKNVTDNVLAKQKFADAIAKEDYLNLQLSAGKEEVASMNEELVASNEQLLNTIEKLGETQRELKTLNHSLEAKVNDRTRVLTETVASLKGLVMNAHYPLMILRGRDWIIEIANQPLVDLWDKTIEMVTGNKLMDILPEIEDQPFPAFLRQVYDTGIGYGQKEQIFHYNSPSGPATKYVSFYYDPLLNNNKEVVGLIVSAEDITDNVVARHNLERSYKNEQELNEEIKIINEELAATNEELTASNEELIEYQHNLEIINADLTESEWRFKNLIKQAPVGICVINASNLIVQDVNDNYLSLVGRQREDLQDRPIWNSVPEAAEVYKPIMDTVINTGKPFFAKEHELHLLRNGKTESVVVDFVYDPIFDSKGLVTMIMVLGMDVTDKVTARKNIEDVEERIRLAVEAAEIGTYDHNMITNEVVSSERFDAIFDVKKPYTREQLLDAIHPDDKHIGYEARKLARKTGKLFYEARVIHNDKSIRWIRVQGNVYYRDDVPVRLLGTVLDITEFKKLQQQKDDFISIASHELKTPITSLKASLQLLERIKNSPSPTMFPRLIDQSLRSMDRITELIDDLLNVSQMGQGNINLRKTDFNVGQMILESIEHIKIAAEYKLVVEGDHSLILTADEHRISQVVSNFVNNAVKYAPDSKEINISFNKVDDDIRIAVKDSGNGILPEKIPHLFERYYRADESNFQVSGLGLGLYISADIVKRHNGNIGVISEVGKGSEFWFTLPIN
ncbi:ATP-binding protein [Pedobacter namyangjuensis]|uniref:ATP-binding protein n=1 Tax=Pedobacter namyangjuensis TaxID=600626 RepID=UPI000DE466F6|nr:ATP-binding protein [Pedobacter namyangjuensis]